jgi:hypothetical protein
VLVLNAVIDGRACLSVASPGASLLAARRGAHPTPMRSRRKAGQRRVAVQFGRLKMLDETRVKQIMLDAILRHKEASTMSLRTAGAVVNAIYDALEKQTS